MIRVKVTSVGVGPTPDISQYVGNHESVWGDVAFHINDDLDAADAWFVLEGLDHASECRVPHGAVVLLTSETSWAADHYLGEQARAFVAQFDQVLTPHAMYFPVKGPNVRPAMPFLPWMINANHGPSINAPHSRDISALAQMQIPEKDRDLSIICSTQARTPEHRMRLAFVEGLKDHFGPRLDWYGNGVQSIDEKWEGLARYRYSIALENQQVPHLITEKLLDCFLAFTHPLYWGAPNADEYFPAQSFTQLLIRDLPQSIDTIEELLSSPVAERSHPALVEARNRVLDRYNMFARMAAIAKEMVTSSNSPELRRLQPQSHFPGPYSRRPVLRQLGETFNKIGDVLVKRSLR